MATSPLIRKSTPEALELHVVRQGESDPNQFTIENRVSGRLEDFDREYFSVSGYFGTLDPQLFCAAPDLLEALIRLKASSAWAATPKGVRALIDTAIAKATGASNG